MTANAPQSPDAAGLEEKGGPLVQGLAGPAQGQGAEDVAVGDDEDVAGSLGRGLGALGHDIGVPPVTNVLDQAIEALGDLLGAPVLGVSWLEYMRKAP